MKSSKLFVFVLPLMAIVAWGVCQWEGAGNLRGFSRAESLLQEIRHGLHPELAKILLITEYYRDSNLRVIFDGNEYHIRSALTLARSYLQRNYHGEAAETWIKRHLSRSPGRGEVIALKFPDGRKRPLSDVLLDDLHRLPMSRPGPQTPGSEISRSGRN